MFPIVKVIAEKQCEQEKRFQYFQYHKRYNSV